jgi:5-methylcytosine-specific restriction endonuclease McrA
MRNYNDPDYKTWRNHVRNRDRHVCKMPGCKGKRKLNVHHIKRWADYPMLRYDPTNGITLCKKCHKLVTGSEQQYEGLFNKIVAEALPLDNSYVRVMRLIQDAKRRN